MSFDPNALGGLMAGFQNQVDALKAEAAQKTVVGKAGGGLVQVTATGGLDIQSVRIDPSLLADGDHEMLEDLVQAATNDALRQAQGLLTSSMQGMLGGMGLPPGLF